MSSKEPSVVMEPTHIKNRSTEKVTSISIEDEATSLAPSQEILKQVQESHSSYQAIGRIIDREQDRAFSFPAYEQSTQDADYQRQLEAVRAEDTFIWHERLRVFEAYRANEFKELKNDLSHSARALGCIRNLRQKIELQAEPALSKEETKIYKTAQELRSDARKKVGSAADYTSEEAYSKALAEAEEQVQALLQGHPEVSDLLAAKEFLTKGQDELMDYLKREDPKIFKILSSPTARLEIQGKLKQDALEWSEFQELEVEVAETVSHDQNIRLGAPDPERLATKIRKPVDKFVHWISADDNKAMAAIKGGARGEKLARILGLVGVVGAVGVVAAGKAYAGVYETFSGLDSDTAGHMHDIEAKMPLLYAEAALIKTVEQAEALAMKMENMVENNDPFHGVNFKLTVEQLGKLPPQQKQKYQHMLSEVYKVINHVRARAFELMVEQDSSLQKIAADKTVLKGPAGEDCHTYGYEATHAGFLKLQHDRSLMIMNGVKNYVESDKNTTGITPDKLTPKLTAFMVGYMTKVGYEVGRVGLTNPADAAFDKILTDYFVSEGKLKPGENLSQLAPDDKAQYDQVRASTLADKGGKTQWAVSSKAKGYIPKGGNIELLVIDVLSRLNKDVPPPPPPPPVDTLSVRPVTFPDKTWPEPQPVPVEGEPIPVEFRADLQALTQILGQIHDSPDFGKFMDQLKHSMEFENVKALLGTELSDLHEFVGDGNGALTYVDVNGHEVSRDFNLGRDLKDWRSFEQFLKEHPVPHDGHMSVAFGGQQYELSTHTGQIIGPDGVKTDDFAYRLTRADGFSLTFQGMHEQQPGEGSSTENVAQVFAEGLGGKLYGEANYTFDSTKDGKPIVGKFDLRANLGPNADFMLKSANLEMFTSFFKFNKETPSESEFYDMKTNAWYKLGDLAKTDDGFNRIWRFKDAFTSALSEATRIEMDANLGGAHAHARFGKSVVDQASVMDKGKFVQVVGARVDKLGPLEGDARAEQLALGIEQAGIYLVLDNVVAGLHFSEGGDHMSATLSANGQPLITVESGISKAELQAGTGAAKAITEAVREGGRQLSLIFNPKLAAGEKPTPHDAMRQVMDALVKEMPNDTKVKFNLGGFLSGFKGGPVAQALEKVGKGLEQEGHELEFSKTDLQQLDAIIQKANMVQNQELWHGAEHSQKKAAMLNELANFATEKFTGGYQLDQYTALQIAAIAKIDADELLSAQKGILVHATTTFESFVKSEKTGVLVGIGDEHAKVVLGLAWEKLHLGLTGTAAEVSQVQVVSQDVVVSAGMVEQGRFAGLDISLGAGVNCRIPIDKINLSGDGGRTMVPLGEFNNVTPTAFAVLDVQKAVGSGAEAGDFKIGVKVIVSPRVDMKAEPTDEPTGNAAFKAKVDAGTSVGARGEVTALNIAEEPLVLKVEIEQADVSRFSHPTSLTGGIEWGSGENKIAVSIQQMMTDLKGSRTSLHADASVEAGKNITLYAGGAIDMKNPKNVGGNIGIKWRPWK